jgi:hypothetical protein
MQRIVRAFPVLPGQEKAVENLAREMTTTRAGDAAAFYRKFSVASECWFAQHTAHGMMVIAITEVADRPVDVVAAEYAESTEPFDAWFKSQILKVSGVDPSIAPLGPPTVCVFDYPAQHTRQS